MRAWLMLLPLLAACAPGFPLESGAYLVADGEDGGDLEGVNLDLDRQNVRFVYEEFAEDRPLADVERDAWPVHCAEDGAKGVPEETRSIGGDPVPLAGGSESGLVISSYCAEEGALRISSPTLGDWDLLLDRL